MRYVSHQSQAVPKKERKRSPQDHLGAHPHRYSRTSTEIDQVSGPKQAPPRRVQVLADLRGRPHEIHVAQLPHSKIAPPIKNASHEAQDGTGCEGLLPESSTRPTTTTRASLSQRQCWRAHFKTGSAQPS